MLRYLILLAGALACVNGERKAVAVLVGTANGTIYFTETADGILITGTVSNITPGKHGFHIHQKGDLSGGCISTGAHFNPHNQTHGGPEDSKRHVGDLGNIEAGQDGIAQVNIVDNVITLDGVNNILGRAVLVHADEDDLGKGNHDDSLTTGHAGARVGCGVIGTLNDNSSGSDRNFASLATVFAVLCVVFRNLF